MRAACVEDRPRELARRRARRTARGPRARRTPRSAASGPSRASASGTTTRRTRPSAAAPRASPPSGAFGSAKAPATARCVSTASRAMNSRMISLEPSKIRLMRKSRIMRSTGIGASPRARSESRGLVAAAAADLQRVVHDLPAVLGVPHLGDRRLEADVVVAACRPSRTARSDDRSIANVVAAISASFCAIASCLPIGCAPLHALVAPTSRQISRQRLPTPAHDGRERQAAGVERDERELQALALAPEEVLLRHAHVVEADDAVLDRLQAHEVAAVLDLDARPRRLDDERA